MLRNYYNLRTFVNPKNWLADENQLFPCLSKRWGEIKTGYGWIHSRKVRYICMVGKSERVVSIISTHVKESRKSKPGDYLYTKGGVAGISGGDNAGFEK